VPELPPLLKSRRAHRFSAIAVGAPVAHGQKEQSCYAPITQPTLSVRRGNRGGAVVHAPTKASAAYMLGLVLGRGPTIFLRPGEPGLKLSAEEVGHSVHLPVTRRV
jgi:hypothetical protein